MCVCVCVRVILANIQNTRNRWLCLEIIWDNIIIMSFMCIYWSLAPAGLLCACMSVGKTCVSVIEKPYVCLSMIVLPDHSHLSINLNLNTQDKN